MADKGHKAIRVLIEDTLKSIDDSVRFIYGRDSDFNSVTIKETKRVQLDLLKESLEYTEDSYNLTKSYQVQMAFYSLDKMQGAESETTQILDEMDILSDKFINKLNLFSLTLNQSEDLTQEIELKNLQKEPLVKVTKDFVTGWVLNLILVAPDDFDYCGLYDS